MAGFVTSIQKKEHRVLVTWVLGQEDFNANANLQPVIGAFVRVSTGRVQYLGRIEDSFYDPIAVADYKRALAMSAMNNEQDADARRLINFQAYSITLLGELSGNPQAPSYLPGVRWIPQIMDCRVEIITNRDLLAQIARISLNFEREFPEQPIRVGVLSYGPDNQFLPAHDVEIRYDLSTLRRRRTAIFGKTGLGKSNLMKTLFNGVLSNEQNRELGALIFDVNGEYFAGGGSDRSGGLRPVFAARNNLGRLLLVSNRQWPAELAQQVEQIEFRFNFYRDPQMGYVFLKNYLTGRGEQPPRYVEAWDGTMNDPSWPTVFRTQCAHIWAYALHQQHFEIGDNDHCGLYSHGRQYRGINAAVAYAQAHRGEGEDAGEEAGQSKRRDIAYRYSYILAALRRYHTREDYNFIDRIIEAFNSGRTVILDLGSVDIQTALFLSELVAGRLWADRNNRFTSVDAALPHGLIVIEEAHNLLSNEQVKHNAVFVRVAKEGRKFNLGLIYVTQRPSSISMEILSQTENFFVMHVSSLDDVKALKNAKIAFEGAVSDVLLTEPVIGLAKVYTEPFQPFVLESQIDEFVPAAATRG
jgi:energy-coupling factor transporter ATP-binding protein EcfA2